MFIAFTFHFSLITFYTYYVVLMCYLRCLHPIQFVGENKYQSYSQWMIRNHHMVFHHKFDLFARLVGCKPHHKLQDSSRHSKVLNKIFLCHCSFRIHMLHVYHHICLQKNINLSKKHIEATEYTTLLLDNTWFLGTSWFILTCAFIVLTNYVWYHRQ
jgi:hypothetical protein